MLSQLNHNELHSISKQLDGMLLKHVNWVTLLHKTIVCNLPPSDSLAMHHKDCDFGKWYYSMTHPMIIENPDFMQLEIMHKILHTKANSILDKYINNVSTTENEYDLFLDSEKEFFNTLNNFIDNVLAIQSQFDNLTNIPNRNLVNTMLDKEYNKFTRNENDEYYIAFADIDYFKHVNDTYGNLEKHET